MKHRALLVAVSLAVVAACTGKKKPECAAMMDTLAPLSEAAHVASQRYSREEMARYRNVVEQTKTKVQALTITDEKLSLYRGELLKLLDMNLMVAEAAAAGPAASLPMPSAAEINEKKAVLENIKTYCR